MNLKHVLTVLGITAAALLLIAVILRTLFPQGDLDTAPPRITAPVDYDQSVEPGSRASEGNVDQAGQHGKDVEAEKAESLTDVPMSVSSTQYTLNNLQKAIRIHNDSVYEALLNNLKSMRRLLFLLLLFLCCGLIGLGWMMHRHLNRQDDLLKRLSNFPYLWKHLSYIKETTERLEYQVTQLRHETLDKPGLMPQKDSLGRSPERSEPTSLRTRAGKVLEASPKDVEPHEVKKVDGMEPEDASKPSSSSDGMPEHAAQDDDVLSRNGDVDKPSTDTDLGGQDYDQRADETEEADSKTPPDISITESDEALLRRVWRDFWEHDNGNFKGDIEKLKSILQERFGPRELQIREHPEKENVAFVRFEDSGAEYGVPYDQEFRRSKYFESSNQPSWPYGTIVDLREPAQMEGDEVIRKGQVEIKR
jgi:hypothetical protein